MKYSFTSLLILLRPQGRETAYVSLPLRQKRSLPCKGRKDRGRPMKPLICTYFINVKMQIENQFLKPHSKQLF